MKDNGESISETLEFEEFPDYFGSDLVLLP
jgi:hypothetical protein